MGKTMTITVDADVFEGLQAFGDGEAVSRLLNDLARPYVVAESLAAGYRDMAADPAREREALEWSEALLGDLADEPALGE